MHSSSMGPPSKPRVGSSHPADASFKRKRGVFQKDLQHMMYGFGDDPNVMSWLHRWWERGVADVAIGGELVGAAMGSRCFCPCWGWRTGIAMVAIVAASARIWGQLLLAEDVRGIAARADGKVVGGTEMKMGHWLPKGYGGWSAACFNTSLVYSLFVLQPLPETVALMEDIAVEYITDLVHNAQDVASKRGKLLTEDFVFLIRQDMPKLHRCSELLSMNEELKQARKAFEVDEEKLAATD
ncbi:hypothetical protein HHK36_010849 [Tetracentron sinense]|uniref:Transcription initiation factor TFIID subunit 13 n=1 Tax=Tetracentron sinense TaxID=13715 RepID=A0A834Z728_TETSI|nr:hypothetical protein HHK36_010849 [Tetracentron sinense]